MSKNTVAVIVTFNRLDKLKEALRYTLEQPFYRVVVVNNCSTDGTREWLDGHSDQRLHLIHTEQNLGAPAVFTWVLSLQPKIAGRRVAGRLR